MLLDCLASLRLIELLASLTTILFVLSEILARNPRARHGGVSGYLRDGTLYFLRRLSSTSSIDASERPRRRTRASKQGKTRSTSSDSIDVSNIPPSSGSISRSASLTLRTISLRGRSKTPKKLSANGSADSDSGDSDCDGERSRRSNTSPASLESNSFH